MGQDYEITATFKADMADLTSNVSKGLRDTLKAIEDFQKAAIEASGAIDFSTAMEKGTKDIQEFEKAGMEAFSKMVEGAGGLSGATDTLGTRFKELGQQIFFWGNNINMATGLAKGAFDTLLGSSLRYADTVQQISIQTGIGSTALQEFGFAADQLESSFSDVSTGLRFLSRNIGGALQGSKEMAAAFTRVGISAQELKSLSIDQIFLRVSDAFASGLVPQAEKARVAMELFGRGGISLVPMLEAGSNAIKGFGTEASAMGRVLTEDTILAFDRLGDNVKALEAAWEGAKNSIASALLPSLIDLTNFLREAAPEWIERIQAFAGAISESGIADSIGNIARAFEGVLGGIAGLGAMTESLGGLKTVGYAVFAAWQPWFAAIALAAELVGAIRAWHEEEAATDKRKRELDVEAEFKKRENDYIIQLRESLKTYMADLEKVQKEEAAWRKKADELTDPVERARSSFDTWADSAKTSGEQVQVEINRIKKLLEELGFVDSKLGIGIDTSDAEKKLQGLQDGLDNIGDAAGQAGNKTKTGMDKSKDATDGVAKSADDLGKGMGKAEGAKDKLVKDITSEMPKGAAAINKVSDEAKKLASIIKGTIAPAGAAAYGEGPTIDLAKAMRDPFGRLLKSEWGTMYKAPSEEAGPPMPPSAPSATEPQIYIKGAGWMSVAQAAARGGGGQIWAGGGGGGGVQPVAVAGGPGTTPENPLIVEDAEKAKRRLEAQAGIERARKMMASALEERDKSSLQRFFEFNSSQQKGMQEYLKWQFNSNAMTQQAGFEKWLGAKSDLLQIEGGMIESIDGSIAALSGNTRSTDRNTDAINRNTNQLSKTASEMREAIADGLRLPDTELGTIMEAAKTGASSALDAAGVATTRTVESGTYRGTSVANPYLV